MAKAKKLEKPAVAPIKVRATGIGLYEHYREPGDVFYISGEVYEQGDALPKGKEVGDVKAFSDRWMELVEEPKSKASQKEDQE